MGLSCLDADEPPGNVLEHCVRVGGRGGKGWLTSQCSTIRPSLMRTMSMTAWPRSSGVKVIRLCVTTRSSSATSRRMSSRSCGVVARKAARWSAEASAPSGACGLCWTYSTPTYRAKASAGRFWLNARSRNSVTIFLLRSWSDTRSSEQRCGRACRASWVSAPYPGGRVRSRSANCATSVRWRSNSSFTRAAERLGTAQPPLSRSIRALERRLGVALFERTNRSVRLTAAGATLLAESGQVLDALEAAEERTRKAGRPDRWSSRPTSPGWALSCCAESSSAAPTRWRSWSAVSVIRPRWSGGRADAALVGLSRGHAWPGRRGGFREPRRPSGGRPSPRRPPHPVLPRPRRAADSDVAGMSPREQAYWAGQDVTGRP